MTISERVAAGTAWLDENRPGWESEINLGRLSLTNQCRCILGQLFGNYFTALDEAKLPNFGRDHGFNARDSWVIGGEAQDAEYAELQAEWVRVITERREAAA